MLKVNHKNIEAFFDYLDEASEFIYNSTQKNYLDSLLLAIAFIIKDDIAFNDLDTVVINELNNLYQNISDITFNKEEIRKAVQLSLLKAFKHLNISFSELTPDTIGILFAYLVDMFFKHQENISIFDATCGCGNLLFSLMNNAKVIFNKIYGVDNNYQFLNVCLHLANLLEYEGEFFYQNNLSKLLVPRVDLIISDLPIDNEEEIKALDLVTYKNDVRYKPYLMMENLMQYGKDGCLFFYLIPNDFFSNKHHQLIKKIILTNTYIQAIIELPLEMFTDKKYQKSILILQKKGKDIKINKEILMLSFPSFSDKDKANKAIEKINQWFNHNKQYGG